MIEQLSLEALYEPVEHKARHADPPTAKRAAVLAFPGQGRQRHRILVAIAAARAGLTYEEASELLAIRGVSVSTRLSELARGGWIELAGERQTSAGVNAQVWVASDAARTALQASVRPTVQVH